MKPYALLADIHLHGWSAFSTIDKHGVNSRLAGLLSEIERAAEEVKKVGGNMLVIAGDLFHVRGKIAPSVLNPTVKAFRKILSDKTFSIVIMPGNHDLEGKTATEVNSAVTVLASIGCFVVTKPTQCGFVGQQQVHMVPWIESVDDLHDYLDELREAKAKETDLILHAPVNGVIPGLPATGLRPHELADFGFRRVFAGHYHNHKEFPGQVFSIGALAHHTWSDIGSKAGFLIVHEDKVVWNKSHLPEFIEMAEDESEAEFEMRIPDNFVRMKIRSTKNADMEAARKWALDRGAKGVIVLSVREETKAREDSGVSIKSGASLESSVADYVRAKFTENTKAIETAAQVCLAEAGVE
jgi:DNA repair exonuclease SbcCD nuclease subunit